MTAIESPKKWYQSKTAWVNFAIALAAFFPEMYRGYLSETNVVMFISFVNLVLRATTKKGISNEIL